MQTTAASSMACATRRCAIGVFASAETGCLCGIGRGRCNVSAQFRSQLFGDDMRVRAIADDLRTDEDDQLGALGCITLMAERVAKTRDLIEHRDRAAIAAL